MKNTKTKAQIEYERERRNLVRRIRTIEKQGFESNLDIKELASRKYTSNVAANRAALKRMRKLTNEMLKRSTNISKYTIDGKIILTPKQYEEHLQRVAAEKREKAKQRRGMESFSKKLRNIEIKAEEKDRASRKNRDVDMQAAKARAQIKDQLFIENFEKGWKASFEDLRIEGTTDDQTLQRFQEAMEWVQKRSFYTELGILRWADIAVKDLITQVLDSDEPTVKSLNMALFEKFIKHLSQYYGYKERV